MTHTNTALLIDRPVICMIFSLILLLFWSIMASKTFHFVIFIWTSIENSQDKTFPAFFSKTKPD